MKRQKNFIKWLTETKQITKPRAKARGTTSNTMAQIKIRPKGKEVFRNDTPAKLFDKMGSYSDVSEYGVDFHGKIYFHYLNGNTERYTRREFIKMAEELEAEAMEAKKAN